MAVYHISTIQRKIGLSTDTKPTGMPCGSTFFEYDTQALWITPDGDNWFPKSIINPTAVTTIDLNQAAADYDLFEAMAQALFIDFLCFVIPADLSAEETLTAVSIQSTDDTPVEFLSAADGAVAELDAAGKHFIYRGPDVIAATKKIQLTIAGGATAAEQICSVYVSYRAAVEGGYLAVS